MAEPTYKATAVFVCHRHARIQVHINLDDVYKAVANQESSIQAIQLADQARMRLSELFGSLDDTEEWRITHFIY